MASVASLRRPVRASAFSLVEMSIVIVIVALLVGAVLEGKSLIQQAKLQATVQDFNKISDAYNQFKQLYNAKPGDFYSATGQKATDVWGMAGGTTGQEAACFSAITLPSPFCNNNGDCYATCNGDGNGYVAGPYNAGALTNANEIYLTFQQLAKAKFLDGTYSGNPTGGAQPGVNVMAGQFENSGYMLLSQNIISDAASAANSPYYFYGNYGTYRDVSTGQIKPGAFIVLGSVGGSGLPENELLKPEDAAAIDAKMDDGNPGTGQTLSYFAYPSGSAIGAGKCLTTGSSATADNVRGISYNLSADGALCNLVYVSDVVVN